MWPYSLPRNRMVCPNGCQVQLRKTAFVKDGPDLTCLQDDIVSRRRIQPVLSISRMKSDPECSVEHGGGK
jgi:hypothetical protein